MTAYGIDEDWQRLSAAQMLAAGKTFVVGYVSEDTTGKNITSAEVQAYLAAGLSVLLVYEYSITAVEGGAARGTRDAGIGIRQARALGYPPGCAIAFAVDEDETAHPSNVDAYSRAFTAACHAAGYRSMVYGGLAAVRRCGDLGLVDLLWQTYAWSGTPTVWDPRAAIRQVRNGVVIAGKAIDLDTAMVADFGAWTGGTMTDPEHTPDPNFGVPIEDEYAADRAVTFGVLLGDDPVVNLPWQGKMGSVPNVLHQKLDALKEQGAVVLAAVQAIALGGIDVAALAAAITAGVIANHDALTTADAPVIKAAVLDALRTGTGTV